MTDDAVAGGRVAHYPSLDGLRGLAIIAVMALHYLALAPVLPTPAGWLVHQVAINGQYGVDLFFVLSGFLITTILLATRESATYFRSFYARRVLRIFPLYYVSLALLLVVIPLLAPSVFGPPNSHVMSPAWFWLYLANWPMAIHGWIASPDALQHFWSLAIEEQFYLAWPAVVLLVPRDRLARVCALLMIAGLLLRYALLHHWPTLDLIGVATFTRLDGLAVGAIVAAWWATVPATAHRRDTVRFWFWMSLAVVLIVRVWRGSYDLQDRIVLTAGLPILAVFFGASVGMALLRDAESPAAWWLSGAPIRWIGRYSYAMYVIHFPVLVALNRAGWTVAALSARLHSVPLGELAVVAVNTACTLGGALISWHLVEQPMLRLKARFPYSGARSVLPTSDPVTGPSVPV